MIDKVEIGNATLYHGDCLEILPDLPEAPALAIMDPPYSSGGFQEAGKSAGSIGTRSDAMLHMDNLSTRGYLRLMTRVFRALRGTDEFYVFTDWRMWNNTFDALEDGGIRVRNMLVWDKGTPGMGRPWRNQHEIIAYGKRLPGSDDRTRCIGNVLGFHRSGNQNHPTEKPQLLIEALLQNAVQGGVIDPFMGSGTTGVACMNLGRKFIGVEIERKYFDIACERISQAQKQGRLFA